MASQEQTAQKETVEVDGVTVLREVAELMEKASPGRRAFVLGVLRRRQEMPEQWLTRDEINEMLNGKK